MSSQPPSASERRAIRVEHNTPDIGRMPLERSAGFSRDRIPQVDGSVRTAACERPFIGTEGNAIHPSMSGNQSSLFISLRIIEPNPDAASDCKLSAVRRKRNIGY